MNFKRIFRKVDIINSYKRVFDSEDGNTVLNDLMKKGYILRPTHAGDDIAASNKNEGKRELVLYIMTKLNMDADKLKTQIERSKDEDLSYS